MMLVVFWSAVALIAYTYVVFPAIVLARSALIRRPFASADHERDVSLVIVAHNEEASIGAKLENILSLDYPRERLQVIVASDGSTDRTHAIVETFASQGIELLPMPRQGKIPALNAAIAKATGDILVFSDANSMYASDAIRALVRPFADPAVGGVAGDQRYLDDAADAGSGERAYWSFDRVLKRAESAAGNTISATGAIYAIRRSLFRTVPLGVTDDFAASTAVIEQGYRLVFAQDAVAYEPVAKASGIEFGRKVRVITRGLRSVIARRKLFNLRRHGFYAIQLFSHKVLRRLVFVPLAVMFCATLALAGGSWAFRLLLLLQVAFYACGLLGWLFSETRLGARKMLSIPFFFCMVNVAALLAVLNLLRGRTIDLWEPQRQLDRNSAVPVGPAPLGVSVE